MEAIFLFFIVIAPFIIQVAIVRWVFRIDHIVMILEKTVAHLEDIKKQNNVRIKQQDEMLELLDTDIES
jgi:hypothetical protein